MADNSLKVTITGPDGQKYQSQIAARLGKMPAAAWPILWKHVVRYWGEVVERRQFISEGAFLGDGQRWFEIDDKYRARKVAAGQFPDIGKRTGKMAKAYQNFFAPTGIFDPQGSSVTFGAQVFEGGKEYSQYFNELRKLFGSGDRLPTEVQFEMGKIAAYLYTMVMRMSRGSAREGEIRFDGEVTASFLGELPGGPIDAYVDDLIRDLEKVYN